MAASRSVVPWLGALVLGALSCAPDEGSRPELILNAGPFGDTASMVAVWRTALPDPGQGARVTAISVSSDGHVVAIEGRGRLLTISSDGHSVSSSSLPATWANANVTAMAFDQVGDLLLWSTEGRLGRFREGSLLEERSTGAGQLLWGRRALTVDANGVVWLGIQSDEAGRQTVEYPRPVYRRLIPAGVGDTLWLSERLADGCPVMPEGSHRSGWYEDFRARYVPFVLWSMTDAGAVIAGCPSRYRFEIDAAGATPATVELSAWTPVGVSPAELRDFELTWRAMLSTRPGSASAPAIWGNARPPDHKPVYSALLPASDGRLWVWTAQPSTAVPANPTWPLAGLPELLWIEAGHGTFDVFGADGRLQGHVRLPEEFPFTPTPAMPEPVVRGDTVWAATETPEGAPGITRFLVDWP